MTRFADKSFTVAPGLSGSYRDNYDAIFGKPKKKAPRVKLSFIDEVLRPLDIPPPLHVAPQTPPKSKGK